MKSVSFALPPKGAFRFAKVMRRHPHGASVLSIAALLPIVGGKVKGARVAYGAMAPTAIRARAVEKALEGKALDAATIAAAVAVATEGTEPADRCFCERLVPVERAAGASRAALETLSGKTMARVPLQFTVNGAEQAEFIEPGALLVDVLRDKLGLTATKNGCGQGTCGACTVLVDGELQLSCLIPARAGRGARGRDARRPCRGGELHPLQRAFAEGFAVQCGFCTSGMILAAKWLLDRNPESEPRRRGRRDLRQHLPLHRLRIDHQRDPGRGRRDARREGGVRKPNDGTHKPPSC